MRSLHHVLQMTKNRQKMKAKEDANKLMVTAQLS